TTPGWSQFATTGWTGQRTGVHVAGPTRLRVSAGSRRNVRRRVAGSGRQGADLVRSVGTYAARRRTGAVSARAARDLGDRLMVRVLRTIVILGASGTMGRRIARKADDAHWRVVLARRQRDKLVEVAKALPSGQRRIAEVDIGDPASLELVFA